MEALLRDCDRMVKRQRTFVQQTSQHIDALIALLAETREQIAQGGVSPDDALEAVRHRLRGGNHAEIVLGSQGELRQVFSRLGRALDKTFSADVQKASRGVVFDPTLLREVVRHHLFREGLLELGELFVKESGSMLVEERFFDMYTIARHLRLKDVQPAITWAATHRAHLEAIGSPLEFLLHRLEFVSRLESGNLRGALDYARQNFHIFVERHAHEVQQLMGCFCFAKRLKQSPYADLFDTHHWTDVLHMFSRDYCALLGLPRESPLYVSVTAGCTAIPSLLRFARLDTSAQIANLGKSIGMEDVGIVLDVERQFQYHSIFTCPISREQATHENPPVMLHCGHVICKQSMAKLSRGNARFKCPYCPSDQTPSLVTELHL